MKPGTMKQILKETLEILGIQVNGQPVAIRRFLKQVSNVSKSGTANKVFLPLSALDNIESGYVCYIHNLVTVELYLGKEDTDRGNEWAAAMRLRFKDVKFVSRYFENTQQINKRVLAG